VVFNATKETIFQLYRGGQFIGGGNRSTRRKPPTCRKPLTNFTSVVFFHTNIMMLGYTILHENSRVVIPGIISIKAMSIHFKHGVIFHIYVHIFLNINV
jgi:hypothetical protein